MKRLFFILAAVAVIAGCGESYEEKRRTQHKERQQRLREDSAALKVAVLPTMDCLPLFVAKAEHLFSGAGADVRLKLFTAQMDCDTAVVGGSVEGAVTDLVRAERIISRGTPLTYVTATDAYWQLYTGRMARITKLPQLDDKMVGMTRYSATALLADALTDSARLQHERVFKIQVNDVHIRLKMLLGGEIDAVLLTEPQASQARQAGHHLLLDSRSMGVSMGVVAFRQKVLGDSTRRRQLEAFTKGYNQAVDSLLRHGVGRYSALVTRYMGVSNAQLDSQLLAMKFHHITPPQEAQTERARKWLRQQ